MSVLATIYTESSDAVELDHPSIGFDHTRFKGIRIWIVMTVQDFGNIVLDIFKAFLLASPYSMLATGSEVFGTI